MFIVLVFVLGGVFMSCAQLPKAPVANKISHQFEIHGEVVTDNYFWLKNRDTPEVLAYLQEENQYADQVLKTEVSLKETLFEEMKQRIKPDDQTPAYQYKNYEYYTRYEIGKEYAIFCRKLLKPEVSDKSSEVGNAEPKAAEEIMLDANALAVGHSYYDLNNYRVAPNQKIVAFSEDTVGRRFYTIKFKNLETGQVLPDQIKDVSPNFEWANDSLTLFYVDINKNTLKQEKLFSYNLKTKQKTEIYFEKDNLFSLHVSKSLTGKYIFIGSSSFNSSEVQYLLADLPEAPLVTFLKREANHEYSVFDGGDGFYILTNDKAQNFKLMKTDYNRPEKSFWKEVVKHSPDTLLEDVLVFKNNIVLLQRKSGLALFEVIDRKGGESWFVKFPDPAYYVNFSSHAEFDTKFFSYTYTSMVRPVTYFSYVFSIKESKLIKQKEVPSYLAEDYQSQRVWAKAQDGSSIPISLVYKKNKFLKGANPLLVYGYGSYGLNMDPRFNSNVISLLDRGFIYAIAHIRGGSEMGRYWYEQGRMFNKINSFTDFIAATEFLTDQGWGDKKNVYAMGGSAGGLLMGAIMNMKPELYKGILAAVPFVDVVNTMLDESIPLTMVEYEQWGNPHKLNDYRYIKSYSPYDNIKPVNYPHLYVSTGYHDSQVQYWEPAKWVAKLRDQSQTKNLIVLRTNMEAGHAGSAGRFTILKEWAERLAFILKEK